jgi:hypothetical protein
MSDQVFDPRDLTAEEAAARIAGLEAPSPALLRDLRRLEEAHPRRPRVTVLRVLEELEGEVRRATPPEVEPLPPLPFRRTTWRGFDLYVCKACGHQEFDAGKAWVHADHHTATRE